MKPRSLQSSYPFSGNSELPDVNFWMEKYSFDLNVTSWRALFSFHSLITLTKCCLPLFHFAAEPMVRSSCTWTISQYKPITDFGSLQLQIANTAQKIKYRRRVLVLVRDYKSNSRRPQAPANSLVLTIIPCFS